LSPMVISTQIQIPVGLERLDGRRHPLLAILGADGSLPDRT